MNQEELAIFEWAGSLRELAELGDWVPGPRAPDRQDLENCDRLAASHGPVADARYLAGRKATRATVEQFQAKLAEDADSKAKLERERIDFYVEKLNVQNAKAKMEAAQVVSKNLADIVAKVAVSCSHAHVLDNLGKVA